MNKVEGGRVPVGTQLNGIYEIDKHVAEGGMGEVYIGHNIQTGDKVAIKMILPEHAHNQVILDLFRKEASTLNRLYHEAIVRYYVFSVDPDLDRPYLAMEFAEGPSLVDRLRERPFTLEELDVLRHRVASGLAAAHKLGVFHRDISPDNVILVNGEISQAKIIDFGIAKSTSAEGTLIGGGFAGKLNYVSPEQLGLGGGEVTGKSDIYSLGLVLAEAATGKPLPMGGTQVEVLDKRRVVPDLAEVPAGIRPLIEWMLQPEPGDRPADMEEVANWGNAPVEPAAAAKGTSAPTRRGGKPEEKKRGFPWLLTGLVAATVAAGAVYLVIQTPPAPDTDIPPEPPLLNPVTATLTAPGGGEAQANLANVNATYVWVSPVFDYSGDVSALTITLDGALPKGLEFENGGDGAGVVFGIPEETGETSFQILATSPEQLTASLTATLTVEPEKPAELAPEIPKPPDAPDTQLAGSTEPATTEPGRLALGSTEPVVVGAAPMLQPVSPGDSGPNLTTPSTGGGSVSGSDLAGLSTTGGGGIATPALTTSPVDPAQGDPAANAAEPVVVGTAPMLQPVQPGVSDPSPVTSSTGGDTAGTGAGSGGDLVALPKPGRTGVASPALTTSPVDPTQGDPGSELPDVTAPNAPAPLAQPGVGASGTGVAVAGGGVTGAIPTLQPAQPDQPFAIPRTGAQATAPDRPEPAVPVQPDVEEPVVAMIEPTEVQNLPPRILDRILQPIQANHGDNINLRLGAFDDEDGSSALAIRVEGRLPNGMQFLIAAGGVAQLYGQPVESGNFSFKVVAVDPMGLIASFPVSLNIAAPLAFRDLREFIVGYDGGPCFLSRPMQLGERMAQIEVFAAEVDPVLKFDSDFKISRGFEANIGLRLITSAQCSLIHALDLVGPRAMDNRLQFKIVKDELRSGEMLEGLVEGGAGARLFLFDHQGGVTDLAQYVSDSGLGAYFKLPLHADGPQVLVAALADASSGLGPTAGLEQFLGAAQRGAAALALGFIVVSK